MSDEENETRRQEAIARWRLKHEAYVRLFGPLSELNADGAVVLQDLDVFCTTFKESIHMDNSGRMDPYTTIYRDGKKAVALRIREMIEWQEPLK